MVIIIAIYIVIMINEVCFKHTENIHTVIIIIIKKFKNLYILKLITHRIIMKTLHGILIVFIFHLVCIYTITHVR